MPRSDYFEVYLNQFHFSKKHKQASFNKTINNTDSKNFKDMLTKAWWNCFRKNELLTPSPSQSTYLSRAFTTPLCNTLEICYEDPSRKAFVTRLKVLQKGAKKYELPRLIQVVTTYSSLGKNWMNKLLYLQTTSKSDLLFPTICLLVTKNFFIA